MSYKFGSALVPGAYHFGGGGLGVLGSAVPATGAAGASYLFNDLALPADAGKEIRGLVLTPPAAGVWFAWEDGSFSLTGAPDGVHTFTYRLYEDGVDQDTTVGTITVGSTADVSGGAVLGDVTATGAITSLMSDLSGTGSLDSVSATGSISSTPEWLFSAQANSFLEIIETPPPNLFLNLNGIITLSLTTLVPASLVIET